MHLDYDEVARRRGDDPQGRRSTGDLEREVARDQLAAEVDALARTDAGDAADPRVERLLLALALALRHGVV